MSERPKKRRTSHVWRYFDDVGSQRAKCNFCLKTLSFKAGTTFNLTKHLRTMHNTEIFPRQSNIRFFPTQTNIRILPKPTNTEISPTQSNIEILPTQSNIETSYCTEIKHEPQEVETILGEESIHDPNVPSSTATSSSTQTVDEAKKEWKGLRDGLRQAMKTKNMRNNGQRAGYMKVWHYEKLLDFLKPNMSSRSAPGIDNTTTENYHEDFYEEEKQIPNNGSEVPSSPHTPEILKRLKLTTTNDKSYSNKVNYMDIKCNQGDDLELFFRSMCEATRKLPAIKQIHVRRQINDLVMSAQEEVMLDQTQATTYPIFNTEVHSPTSNQSWSSTSAVSNLASNF